MRILTIAKTVVAFLVSLMVILMAAPNATADVAAAGNIATAHRIESAPIIDGRLDDACWKVGSVLNHFTIAGLPNEVVSNASQTEVSMAWDNDNLYVGAKLNCPNPAHLMANVTNSDSDAIFEDDILEVFLDPQGSGRKGFHIAVNSLGTVRARAAGSAARIDGIIAKTSIGTDSWNIEMAISLKSLGAAVTAGQAWTMNVAREQKVPVSNTSWSPLDTASFLTWNQFGRLVFGGPAAVRVRFPQPLTVAAREPFAVELTGDSMAREVTVQFDKSPASATEGSLIRKISLKPGETSTLTFDQSMPAAAVIDGTAKAHKMVRVLDTASGALLAQVAAEQAQFDAGAVIRDTPSAIREVYQSAHPELCSTDKRLIYNGAVYISPDHITPRSISFFHNATTGPTIINNPQYDLRLVLEMPAGVEVTAVAALTDTLLTPGTFPEVAAITLNGKPGKSYTFKPGYIQNPLGDGSHMMYFKTSLKAGSVAEGRYYLKWNGGQQKPQTMRLESISIPKVKAPRRFMIMPWGLHQSHLQLLSPNFPADYTSLGFNLIDYTWLGNMGPAEAEQKTLREYLKISDSIAKKAKAGGVFQCYNSFFPYAPGVNYGMSTWMSDPDAWAYTAEGKPTPGWLAGHTPCPSYRGKFYKDAVAHLENSEQLKRAPASFFSMDTEYYNGRGTQLCFCPRCVGLFEKWFRKKYPKTEYIDPFTIEKNTKRPDTMVDNYKGTYEVDTKYPLQYKAWVEFKIEQFADLIGGFKTAIGKAVGKNRTAPFKDITFADWAGVYPTVLQQEQAVFGTHTLDTIELCAIGAYSPPAFAFHPDYAARYSPTYFEKYGKRRSIYDTPATSGAWNAAGYAAMPEHSRYYLLESAMNGPQGFLMFHYTGLEGKQLQLNAPVFGAFALVDDLITEGKLMKPLKITGKEMHARGLQIGRERLILAGDNYVATDKRSGVLTCPVEERMPVYDILKRKKIGELTPQKNTITLTIDGLNDRARFLYIGKNWENRVKGNF